MDERRGRETGSRDGVLVCMCNGANWMAGGLAHSRSGLLQVASFL